MAPALVLLHGFTQTSRAWDGVRAALGERYRVLAPDLRGHGAAAAERPVGFPEIVADVAALAPERFVLCGYSMGGRLALHVALAHPERVERLVLVGATPGIADEVEREERRAADAALAEEIERDGVEAFARRWGAQPLFKGQPRAVREAAREDRLRNEAAGLAASLRGVGTGAMPPLWSRLPELRMPVCCVAGERDGKFRKIAERMAGRLPAGECVIVPGAGHAVALEAPDVVARLVG